MHDNKGCGGCLSFPAVVFFFFLTCIKSNGYRNYTYMYLPNNSIIFILSSTVVHMQLHICLAIALVLEMVMQKACKMVMQKAFLYVEPHPPSRRSVNLLKQLKNILKRFPIRPNQKYVWFRLPYLP